MAARNLVNFDAVTHAYGDKPLLTSVSLGVGEGERIAVVGRNGAGKSTLLGVMAGDIAPLEGRVTVASDAHVESVTQSAVFDDEVTIAEYVVPGLDVHEWATRPRVREVLNGLLGGFDDTLLARRMSDLSGGERRRAQLARALIADADLLLLDEPTNHLDVEVIAWLVEHLRQRPRLALVVVTHDRWFLDALCDRTWEVVGGSVEEYDGGYSAYVLAKAERERQAAATESRRRNLLRKELAWLRRGAPARTSKPKFRIEAANELIEGEPPPRDDASLLAFASARLGKLVIDSANMDVSVGDRELITGLDWSIGPGDRIGLLGANGAGKTTLIRALLGEIEPAGGTIRRGSTVRAAYLSQHLEELDPERRVLQAVEDVAQRVELGADRELTASQLCERLGFGSDAQWTPVGDLSGGERRRLQLTRLLMSGPNVLVLDEPTNDFDVETLAALEDLLDGFGGTLIVVSHDRYFLERTCADYFALLGDARVTHLPGGVDEYLSRVSARSAPTVEPSRSQPARISQADVRAKAKELAKLERALAKAEEAERALHAEMADAATDHERLSSLNRDLQEAQRRTAQIEEEWLALADS